MSEHPDWREFKLEEESMSYNADMSIETEDNPPAYSEEEWKSLLARYTRVEEEGVDV